MLQYSAGEVWLEPERNVFVGIFAAVQLLATCLVASALCAVAAELIQNRFQFRPSFLVPQLARIDPICGARRLLKGSVRRTLIVLGRAPLGAVLMWAAIRPLISAARALPAEAAGEFVVQCARACAWTAAGGIIAAAVAAAIEYCWTRRELLRELSMSDDELRREQREDEGDPAHRAMRRALHQALAREDLVRRVRKSKVIVVERSKR